MARDLRRLKDEAATAFEKKRWDDAARLYAEISALEVDDGRWALRCGEIHKRRNRNAEAVGWFDRAARAFLRKGFLVKAVAVARMIQAIDPRNDALMREIEQTTSGTRALPAAEIPMSAASARHPPPSAIQPLRPSQSGVPALGIGEVTIFDDAPDGIELEMTELDFESVERRSIPGLDTIQDEPPSASSLDQEIDAETLAKLPAFPLFAGLEGADFDLLARRLLPLEVDAGEIVVREGDPADSMYVIVAGRARVERGAGVHAEYVAQLGEGDVFGEMATLLEAPRQASVIADTDVHLLALSASDVRRLAQERPMIGERIMRLVKRRALVNVLGSAELFAAFEPTIRLEVARMFEVREATAGTELLRQGRHGDGLFVLLTGRALVERDGRVVAQLHSGGVIGEHSMMTARHAMATVRMLDPGLVLRLPRTRFQELISRFPPVLEHLAELQSEREIPDAFSITLV